MLSGRELRQKIALVKSCCSLRNPNRICIKREGGGGGGGERKFGTQAPTVPKQADVVIIGGGIAGCNLLYHLSKRGINAVVLEKGKITCGTTWHTSGLVWSLRPSDLDVQINGATKRLVQVLEQETGQDTGWQKLGGLFIAKNDIRIDEYKRLHTLGHYFGIESDLISSKDAAKLSPILDASKFKAALYSPSDGVVDPSMYCAALTKGAGTRGGKVLEKCFVEQILVEKSGSSSLNKITGVQTSLGTIKTSCVVNATGVWSRNLLEPIGISLPIAVIKHAYILTESVPSVRGTPSIRVHDGSVYTRVQGDALMIGGYESNPEIIKEEMPLDFEFNLFDLNPDVFDTNMRNAIDIAPSLANLGVKRNICGAESFTPDHKPIMGEDYRLIGLYHSCGYNSAGMMMSGGCGEQLAVWITQGRPDFPMYAYDIRRFSPGQRSHRAWITETSHEAYAKNYSIVFPHDQPLAGRNFKIDAFHESLVANGAVMEQAQGWERPGYFVKDRTVPVRGYDWYGNYDHKPNEDVRYVKELENEYVFGFSKNQPMIGEEAEAVRNNVAIFDNSYYTKMYLTGPDASQAADWLFTADVDKEPGRVVYSCCLNSKGGVEADVTVTLLEEGVGTLVGPILKGKGYYVVAGGASGYQAISHLKREIARKNFKALITDITDQLGILSIQGPKSGELLQSITETPITDEKFPPSMSHLISVDGNVCRAKRISFVGELGYELHIPYAACVPIYNRLIEAGRGFELRHAGFRALYSLNLEKGYHLWNWDLRTDDNPIEAALGQSVCRTHGQYLGKQHVERARQVGVKRRRVFFTLDPQRGQVALFGLETIWRDDTIVGYLRRGEYAFHLGCSIGSGYIKHPKGDFVSDEYLKSGNYEIEVMNKRYPASLYLRSPFDVANQRIFGKYDTQFEEQTHFED